jgi:hypothetical protein
MAEARGMGLAIEHGTSYIETERGRRQQNQQLSSPKNIKPTHMTHYHHGIIAAAAATTARDWARRPGTTKEADPGGDRRTTVGDNTVGDNELRAITIFAELRTPKLNLQRQSTMQIVRSILKAMYNKILLFKKNNYQSKHFYLRKHTIIRSLLRSRTMWQGR